MSANEIRKHINLLEGKKKLSESLSPDTQISLTITLTKGELLELAKTAGRKITNMDKFDQFIQSQEFKKLASEDIKHVWELANEEAIDNGNFFFEEFFDNPKSGFDNGGEEDEDDED